VLTVTTGEKRLDNLRRLTEEAEGKVKFWFTTFDQLTPETVLTAPIWQVASLPEPKKLVIDEWWPDSSDQRAHSNENIRFRVDR